MGQGRPSSALQPCYFNVLLHKSKSPTWSFLGLRFRCGMILGTSWWSLYLLPGRILQVSSAFKVCKVRKAGSFTTYSMNHKSTHVTQKTINLITSSSWKLFDFQTISAWLDKFKVPIIQRKCFITENHKCWFNLVQRCLRGGKKSKISSSILSIFSPKYNLVSWQMERVNKIANWLKYPSNERCAEKGKQGIPPIQTLGFLALYNSGYSRKQQKYSLYKARLYHSWSFFPMPFGDRFTI